MKLLWRLSKAAKKYKGYYIIAVCATLLLTVVNLAAPKVLSAMTATVQNPTPDALSTIGWLTVLLLVLYLSRILFRYLSSYMSHKAAWNLVHDLRIRIYDHIQHFPMGFFHDKQTGDLMSRVVNDTGSFELLYAHIIPEMITNITTLIGVLIVLLTINVKLALFTCIPIPFILYSGKIYVTKVRPNFRASQKALAGLNAKLQDNFSGIHEIQAFGQEESECEQVEKQVNVFTKAMLHAVHFSGIFHPTVEFLSSIGTIMVVGIGGVLALTEGLSVPDIVAFMLYLSLFYTPISGLARLLEEGQQALAGAERVADILDLDSGIQDAPDAVDLIDPKGSITFSHVDFSYEDRVPVLKDICLDCEPGKMIALVGPTGVGKTTLTQLISRFYEPVSGRVLIDGKDVSKLTLKSLRAAIAPVMQDTFLFNGTILDNIRYADPDATDEEVAEAARAAHIHEAILAMPDGYQTHVGERGVRLSGGQKQRIAIARAILRKAPIIILDEATASVDVETEREIQQAIANLAGSRTIVAIAHRLSTIQSADQILVLEEGRIVQRGTHEELLKAEGLYRRLWMAQDKKQDYMPAGD